MRLRININYTDRFKHYKDNPRIFTRGSLLKVKLTPIGRRQNRYPGPTVTAQISEGVEIEETPVFGCPHPDIYRVLVLDTGIGRLWVSVHATTPHFIE